MNTGEVLSETIAPNGGKTKGLRDGVMGVAPTTDGTNGVVVTGYIGGEANYDKKTNQCMGMDLQFRSARRESRAADPPSHTLAFDRTRVATMFLI